LFLVVLLACLGATAVLAWRRSPYTVIAAAAGAVIASPKLFGYDVTAFLAVHPDGKDDA
jgi:hypothetical protein